MQKEPTLSTKWTDENIVDLVRKIRNDLIKDFLDERHLKQFLADQYGVRDFPLIKIELIKASLKDLLISPVDVVRYDPVIRQIRETDTASLSEGNDILFYKEIEAVLKNHIF